MELAGAVAVVEVGAAFALGAADVGWTLGVDACWLLFDAFGDALLFVVTAVGEALGVGAFGDCVALGDCVAFGVAGFGATGVLAVVAATLDPEADAASAPCSVLARNRFFIDIFGFRTGASALYSFSQACREAV